jgi:Rad3-related DNA helicase
MDNQESNLWVKNFPYKDVRQQQQAAIEKIIDCMLNNDKRFFALEAGTGVGKSAIGLTIARTITDNVPTIENNCSSGAYFLTTQKILQEQYVDDFSKFGLKSLKGTSSYPCNFKKQNNCHDSAIELKMLDSGTAFWRACTFDCNYKNAKSEWLESNLSITNFSYFMTAANYQSFIKQRQILIIDEAHNIETELSKFIEITISEKFASGVLGLEMDESSISTSRKSYKWINEVYFPKLSSHLDFMLGEIEKYTSLKNNLEQFKKISNQLKLLQSHHQKIEQFLSVYEKDNWSFEINKSDIKKYKKLMFKPIDVSQFAEQYLFKYGHKVLFMSATLLSADKFAEGLGIDKDNIESISIESPFPVKNRPIVFAPVGKMSAGSIDTTLPNLASAIEQILLQHEDDKGIIHVHSYKIANYLERHIKSKRLLFPNADNRDDILLKHKTSKKPTVLVSPSMTEGVDLYGDSSRFQIICKIPYPYLGDKLVSKRMHRWDWWYPFQTVKTIIQSVGRSIRSADDSAVTYILDSDWKRFFGQHKALFPEDFKNCIVK